MAAAKPALFECQRDWGDVRVDDLRFLQGVLVSADYLTDEGVNHHNQRCTGTFADGHAAAARVSTYGFQYYPGKDAANSQALGLPELGGNGKYDPRWKWDPE